VPREDPENKTKRKLAHVAALERLADRYPFEYAALQVVVETEQPRIAPSVVKRKAKARLRLLFPHSFHILYNEEKVKLGLPARERDYVAVRDEIISLYDDGKGLSRLAIAAELDIDHSWVTRVIRQEKAIEESEGEQ
jgi:hypothetical protein